MAAILTTNWTEMKCVPILFSLGVRKEILHVKTLGARTSAQSEGVPFRQRLRSNLEFQRFRHRPERAARPSGFPGKGIRPVTHQPGPAGGRTGLPAAS